MNTSIKVNKETETCKNNYEDTNKDIEQSINHPNLQKYESTANNINKQQLSKPSLALDNKEDDDSMFSESFEVERIQPITSINFFNANKNNSGNQKFNSKVLLKHKNK